MGYVLQKTHEIRRCLDCGRPVEVKVSYPHWVVCEHCLEWLAYGTALFRPAFATKAGDVFS